MGQSGALAPGPGGRARRFRGVAPTFAASLPRLPVINRLRFLSACLSLLLAAAARPALAQQPAPAPARVTPPPPERVLLLPGTERLEGGSFNGEEIRKLIGNVRFRQGDTFLYCDSAYQYPAPSNRVVAFSNVRLVQADTVTITGQRLDYDGDARTARMRGTPVRMVDPRMTLTTDVLDYDLNRRLAYYTTGGHLEDPQNQLDSQRGSYSTAAKTFGFRGNVVLRNPDYTVTCDTLNYNTLTKIATFVGPTTMRGQKGDLYAEAGTYNTLTKQSDFRRNARLESSDYRLSGDKLTYDEATRIGIAVGRVTLVGKKDSVIIRGAYGHTNRLLGRTRISGSPVLENVTKRDTLLIAADTLMATESRADSVPGLIYGWRAVKIWNPQVQGAADSLVYNLRDSVIFLHRRPILWAGRSQLVADTMRLYLRRRRLERLVLRVNSFIVSQDTLLNFNQVKGRHMVAHFGNNRIRRVDVDGNGESLYYALDADTALTGMNRVICSDMRIAFRDGKVGTITFLTRPDARFIPPHELKPEDERLDNFQWRPTERPTRAVVRGARAARVPPPKPAKTRKSAKAKGQTKAPSKGPAKPAKAPPKPQSTGPAPARAVPAQAAPKSAAVPKAPALPKPSPQATPRAGGQSGGK